MGLFDKKKEPIILKESSCAKAQIDTLNELLLTASPEMKPKIEQDIKMLSYGISGEEQILFELKNSHIPMYVLHDLYLEDNGLTAQIDFLVITTKVNFVIECKNLIGNIEINSNGDFIRTMSYGKKAVKEGIYSPITQNQRHLELLKSIASQSGHTFLKRVLPDKWFFNFYKGVIVLANSKTMLNDKYAKKEVKQQVIRADQLVEYIRDANTRSRELAFDDKAMESLAQFFLSKHQENTMDYAAKYKAEGTTDVTTSAATEKPIVTQEEPAQKQSAAGDTPEGAVLCCPKCGAAMTLRTATKGERAGKHFWGCSNYPRCRSIINIE